MENIINQIKLKLDNPIKYRVVFDVDDVLCCSPISFSHHIDKKEEIAFHENITKFPQAVVIEWQHNKSPYIHFFFPDLDKLILTILTWENWSVDFFSSGVKERNEEVIPILLKKLIAKHSNNPDADYELIVNSGRCRVFSRDHMVNAEALYSDYKLTGYELFGNRKKDLKAVSDDIDNTILVDDDRTYVTGDQYPFICTSYQASLGFASYLKTGSEYYRKLFDPVQNAYYILGIVLACKKKLDAKEALSLRSALDLVLRHKGKTAQTDEDRSSRPEATPWYLHPATELETDRDDNVVNPVFLSLMQSWIQDAKEYWSKNFVDSQ